jgi:hypothetical protein
MRSAEDPMMVSPRVVTRVASAAAALALAMALPSAGFAEYKANTNGVRGGGAYRPSGNVYRPGTAVVAAPAVGGFRGGAQAAQPGVATPMAQPGGARVYGGYNGGYNGGYRGGDRDRDRDRDHDRDRGAFVAGVIVGGAIASQGYSYGAPGYYSDQYYDGGPALAPAPAGDDAVSYCMQTYSSYDPQSGTYVGSDGYQHPCP